MKVVMTLLARNEADIVDAQLAFHLHAGVDFVIATDNRSDDGTTEILERYARAGVLHLIHEPGDDMRQQEWVTRMARLAATDFGADWVINSDADEFWWPRGGTLKDVLERIPGRYGIVRGAWRHFLPTTNSHASFAERMTVRLTTPASPGETATIYHADQKAAHRALPDVVVQPGNHDAAAPGLIAIRNWHPLEVLHFSFRSLAQFERQSGGYESRARGSTGVVTLHNVLAYKALRAGRGEEYFAQFVVDEAALERGLAAGTLAVDTRLRDALRKLRGEDDRFLLPTGEPLLTFGATDALDSARYAAERSPLLGIDGIVRAEQRVASLEERITLVERRPWNRLRERLAPRA